MGTGTDKEKTNWVESVLRGLGLLIFIIFCIHIQFSYTKRLHIYFNQF